MQVTFSLFQNFYLKNKVFVWKNVGLLFTMLNIIAVFICIFGSNVTLGCSLNSRVKQLHFKQQF